MAVFEEFVGKIYDTSMTICGTLSVLLKTKWHEAKKIN